MKDRWLTPLEILNQSKAPHAEYRNDLPDKINDLYYGLIPEIKDFYFDALKAAHAVGFDEGYETRRQEESGSARMLIDANFHKGEWINYHTCSCCGEERHRDADGFWLDEPFCHRCGAKMSNGILGGIEDDTSVSD